MSEFKEQFAHIDPMALYFAEGVASLAVESFGDEIEEVRLFGSHAQGTPKPESDIDVMVIMRREFRLHENDRIGVVEQLSRLARERDLATEGLHILVVNPDEFNNPRASKVLANARSTSFTVPLPKITPNITQIVTH